jgi:hypothetical protein
MRTDRIMPEPAPSPSPIPLPLPLPQPTDRRSSHTKQPAPPATNRRIVPALTPPPSLRHNHPLSTRP